MSESTAPRAPLHRSQSSSGGGGTGGGTGGTGPGMGVRPGRESGLAWGNHFDEIPIAHEATKRALAPAFPVADGPTVKRQHTSAGKTGLLALRTRATCTLVGFPAQ
jgi:hypothetical protein